MPRNSAEKHSYFIKDKAGFYYITKDIYSKRGLLLIRKGQKVSPKTMSKLIRLKFQNPEILNDRYDINNPTFFPDDQPSDILNSDSQQKNIFTSSNLPEDIFTSNIQQRDTCTLNSQPEAIFTPRSRKRDILTPATKKFGEKMNIKDYYILEKPNKVLSNIIFESKSKPWWIYVNALANYVDWIYTHSIDVAIMAIMMAEKLGYGDEELYDIGFTALLHDVGKLLVPKPILQKPEGLTDMERSFIRQHCELGASSLERFDIPQEFMDIVMQHHERLDGSGYPKGLKENEISINARITMVADTVDAVTSYRPYREAQNMDAAIKILRDNKEKYPQELVSLLESILKQ